MSEKFSDYLDFLNSGNLSFKPFLVLEEKGRVFPEYTFSINEKSKRATLSTVYDGIIKDDLYISFDERQMICKRTTENIGKENIELCEVGVKVEGISFCEDSSKDYYYHIENPRSHMKMLRYVDSSETAKAGEFDEQAGTAWFTEDTTDRIGAGPGQPFTAILISNTNTNKGLVHGTLSQDVYFHSYKTSKNSGATALDIFSSFKCIHALTFEPERVLVDEWYMGRTEEADNYEKIFAHYTDALRAKLPKNIGLANINRDNLIWGSWNDGIFRDVNEEMLLKEARFLKENFPTVKWLQLDDGYAVFNSRAHGLGVAYEGDEGIDKEKFPEGLRAYADKVREIGLRPALWIGDWCPEGTKINAEKGAEFVVDPALLDDQVKTSGLLDVSKPEVREYMHKAIGWLVNTCGFDGIKLDFWTYPFETTSGGFPLKKTAKSVYSNRTHSGYEYRRWWLDEIRQALPGDGYLQTGCAIGMGDPFLGEFVTNYRYGIDIGGGAWKNVKTCYLWGVACVATHTGDLFVPNSDSIGLLPGLSDKDAMFWINFCLVTHTMVEIAGLLSNAPKDDKLKRLQKVACNPNNGQDVYFVNFDYRNEAKNIPTIMYFKTPHFSTKENSNCMPVRTVGIFNPEEETTVERFTIKDLGLEDGKYIITNVWTGEQKEFTDSFEISMGAHDSVLLAVSQADDVQIYDANIRILDAANCDKVVIITTDYAMKEAEIIVNKKVSEILFNSEKIAFTQNGDKVAFDLPGKGELKLIIG